MDDSKRAGSVEDSIAVSETQSDEQSHEKAQNGVLVFEDISAAKNSRQFIMTTDNDLISAKNIHTDVQAVQYCGKIDKESLKVLLKNFPQATIEPTTQTSDSVVTQFSSKFVGSGRTTG
jgi:hypothetical protein